MSVAISRDTMETVLLPGGEGSPDAIDKLIGTIKGAVAVSIDEDDNWHVLVQLEDCFKWMPIDEVIPTTSERTYKTEKPKLTSLSVTPKNTP